MSILSSSMGTWAPPPFRTTGKSVLVVMMDIGLEIGKDNW